MQEFGLCSRGGVLVEGSIEADGDDAWVGEEIAPDLETEFGRERSKKGECERNGIHVDDAAGCSLLELKERCHTRLASSVTMELL